MSNKDSDSSKLGLGALIAIATGQVIGAGIITTTGIAIGETGRAVWLAYALSVFIGFVWILPIVFFSSIARYKGGNYALVTILLGEQSGGLYSVWYIPMYLATAMVGTGIGQYIHTVIPEIPAIMAGIVPMVLFYIINLMGVKLMANFQKPMTAMLCICLAAFAIVGISKVQPGSLDISSEGYFLNGSPGFFSGIILLIYSTSGHSLVAGFSWEAKNPKKDIPIAIMVSTIVILVLYVAVSFAAGNVLPIEDVAGKPLTVAAKYMFSDVFYILFVICGPVLALITTLNSGFAALTAPILGGVRNGWLPTFIAKTNKHGAPVILYTIMFLLGAIPVLFGVSLKTLTNFTVITQRITGTLVCLAMFMIPKKCKAAWEKSWLHMPDPLFYLISAFALGTQVYAVYLSAKSLGPKMFGINMVVVIALGGLAIIRYRMGKVHSNILCEIGEED